MKRYTATIWLMLTMVSCKKFIELQPGDRTTGAIVFSNAKNAETAVNGMYGNMSVQGGIYANRLYVDIALMGDELKTTSTSSIPFAENNLNAGYLGVGSFWSGHYSLIYEANLLIEKLPAVPDISPAQLATWTAEAKMIRAWSYFYLAQLFGNVPKVTTAAWKENTSLPRSPLSEIHALISQDLIDAEAGLPHDHNDAEKSRIRATKGAARGLLVKYYMLTKDWARAEAKATELINDSAMYNLNPAFADVFKSNSTESIWELWFGENTPNGLFNSFQFGSRAQYTPSTKMTLAFIGSTGDTRTPVSISAGKVNKYLSNTARTKLLRLGDIYLLRAEARARQDKLSEAASDLNRIRSRAGLAPSAAATQAELLLAIEKERFLELAFEGHRWFDLVRTDRATAVLSPLKPVTWQTTDVLLPVPQTEINLNPSLLPQNPGF